MQYTHTYPSPLGPLLLASDGNSLTGCWFEGQKYFARGLDPKASEAALPIFRDADHWLDLYFSGQNPDFSVPMHPKGTVFQETVWALLSTIPYGTTTTYGFLAKEIARRRSLLQESVFPSSKTTLSPPPHSGPSARAVGGAVGKNPISIFIPCHRVIGTDGSLTGYAGGTPRKIRLLELENWK